MKKSSNSFIAGAAAVDITPLDVCSVYLAGFAPNRKAAAVRDPLYARVLFLFDGQTKLAIVSLDLIGLSYPVAEKIRKAIKIIPYENVFLACTHSHSGPDTMGLWGPAISEIPFASGVDPAYLNFLQDRIVHAVGRAKTRALPATIGFGHDTSQKGDLTWNVREQGLLDHELSVMKIERVDGDGTIAVLSNYASHPEVLWERNLRISPDYPAPMNRKIEKATGGVSIFVSGALGGMATPGLDEDTDLPMRESFYIEYGKKIANFALEATANTTIEQEPKISIQRRKVNLPLENNFLRFANGLGLLQRSITWRGVETEVGLIKIGEQNIVTMPGEVLPTLGLRIKRKMPNQVRFLFGLCDDEIGYILEEKDFHRDLYEYERSMSVGSKSADLLADAIIDMLNAKE